MVFLTECIWPCSDNPNPSCFRPLGLQDDFYETMIEEEEDIKNLEQTDQRQTGLDP